MIHGSGNVQNVSNLQKLLSDEHQNKFVDTVVCLIEKKKKIGCIAAVKEHGASMREWTRESDN